MTDEIGQKLEFKYISLVFKRGQAEQLVKDLTDRLELAIARYQQAKIEEEAARDEINKHYGKQMLI